MVSLHSLIACVPKTLEYEHLIGHIGARTMWLMPGRLNRAISNSLLRNLTYAIMRDADSLHPDPVPHLIEFAKAASLTFFAPHMEHRFDRKQGREGVALAAFLAEPSKIRSRLERIAALPGFSINAPVSYIEDPDDWRAQGGVVHTLVFLICQAIASAALESEKAHLDRALPMLDALEWALSRPDANVLGRNAFGRTPEDILADATRALEGFADESAILKEIQRTLAFRKTHGGDPCPIQGAPMPNPYAIDALAQRETESFLLS